VGLPPDALESPPVIALAMIVRDTEEKGKDVARCIRSAALGGGGI
jgi:hypothetical protein